MAGYLDEVVNFGVVTVNQGYDAAATSIVLQTGNGSKLPGTTETYNLTWWNANTSDLPATPEDDPNKEIVRVTSRSGDTLIVTRGQEGTSAATHNVAGKVYKMVLAPTKKTRDDINLKLKDLRLGIFRAHMTADEVTIASATPRKLTLNAADINQGSFYDSTTNYRFTNTTGSTIYVAVRGSMYVSASTVDATKKWDLIIRKNGSDLVLHRQRAAWAEIMINISDTISLANNDYLELWVLHDLGSNQTVNSASTTTYFSGHILYSGV